MKLSRSGSCTRAAAALATLPLVLAAGHGEDGTPPLVRRGADRASAPYEERAPRAKAALLARLNRERSAAGVPPLAYDLVGAKAGDRFCLDAARTRVMGHWDLAGHAPYDRYADAGGVDYHAENFSGATRTGAPFRESELEGLLLDAHEGMMAERPGADAHRRTALDPRFTHVGFGVALEGGEFRMTEEYSRHVVEWLEIPAGPVPVSERSAPFAALLPKGWTLALVEVAHARFPRPLSRREIARRGSYAYPPVTRRLLPRPAAPQRTPDGASGDLAVSSGVVRATVRFLEGPGEYWVFVYAAPGDVAGRSLTPLTAARITALSTP